MKFAFIHAEKEVFSVGRAVPGLGRDETGLRRFRQASAEPSRRQRCGASYAGSPGICEQRWQVREPSSFAYAAT
jgi:hypothetical protein